MPERSTPKTLLVEDEPAIRLAVRDALDGAGHRVEVAEDGTTALSMAMGHAYDLIVLDLMLPGLDGMEVCRRLRAAGKRTPLLMLTARGGEPERVEGLKAGADDYLPKPFSVRELLARCGSLLRRATWNQKLPGTRIACDGIEVDLERLDVMRGATVLDTLTPREGDILRHLLGNEGRVASKRELLMEVWGYPDVELETRTVENTIGVLRRKLERASGACASGFVVTVRGAGFKLGPEVSVACDG